MRRVLILQLVDHQQMLRRFPSRKRLPVAAQKHHRRLPQRSPRRPSLPPPNILIPRVIQVHLQPPHPSPQPLPDRRVHHIPTAPPQDIQQVAQQLAHQLILPRLPRHHQQKLMPLPPLHALQNRPRRLQLVPIQRPSQNLLRKHPQLPQHLAPFTILHH
ncbi:MAG: hypothetical protein ACK2UP_08735 [Candidatus Promineifilaceae bacterium]